MLVRANKVAASELERLEFSLLLIYLNHFFDCPSVLLLLIFLVAINYIFAGFSNFALFGGL